VVEEFKIILLNRQNRVLGIVNLSSGGFAGVVVDSKVIFSTALTA
jgi:DNA repair protein RadC